MRKVKVLALLLAALMVVAVFAGCADTDAIVADVDSLEDRVTALEGLLNDQKDAIDDVKDQIGDVSDKLDDDTTADQLAATLEALKQLQEAMNAQNEQIKDLADKVTKVEEDNKESSETADDDAALQAAVKVYTAKLQELKITCELSKDDYVPADYTAVVKALSDAIVAIADAEKAADVEKLYNDAKAVYDAKATVYSKLINYYSSVRNAITADSKDLVAEIKVFLDGDAVNLIPSAVTTVYPTLPAKVTAYKNGDKNADGTDVEVNLVDELRNAIAAYAYLTGTTFKTNVAAAIAAIKAIDVVTIDAAGITAVSNAKTAYQTVATEINGLANVNAKYLADSNLDLVTNYADLAAAEARLNQLTVAKAMYSTLGTVSGGSVQSVFAGYKALTPAVNYTKKAVYDAIDNVLATWVSTYALEEKNVAIIVDSVEGTGFYALYKADKHETALCVKAYTDFAAIANKVAALNKVTTVAASALTEYKAVVDAIEAWKVLQKDDATTPLVNEKIVIDDYNFNLILAAYGFDATATDADMTKATFYYGLYDFVDTAVDTFFATQYASIDAEVKAINDNIKELKANLTAGTKYTDIARYLELEGLYADADNNGTYTKVTVTKDDKALKANGLKKDSLTIAAFTKKYEAYDLTSLLNLADFEAAKAGAIERIAGFKAGAENIAKLVEAIDYVELKEGANAYTFSVPAKGDTVYYYVNLSDAEAIDAANKAYTAWINAGANSSLAEWVPYVDPTTEEVVPDTYEFVTIADADVLAALKQMNERVATLKSMAAKLVAHYELVAEVWNAVSANVTLASDLNTASVKVLSLHNATLDAGYTVTIKGNKVPGVIPVAVSAASANSFSYNGKTYELAAKGSATDFATADAASDDLQTLIEKGNDAYEAFMAMNRNITIKADKSGLDKQDYVKDSAVEAAVKGIAAAELVMVKDAALDAVATADTLTEYQKAQYTEWLNGATAVHGYTGTTVWVYAQQIYAQSESTLRINAIQRGTEVVDDGKADTNKTAANVFTAPSYDNIG